MPDLAVRAQHLTTQRMGAIGLVSLNGVANRDLSRAVRPFLLLALLLGSAGFGADASSAPQFTAMNGPVIIKRFIEWFTNKLVPRQLGEHLSALPAHHGALPMMFRADPGTGTSSDPLRIVCPAVRVPVLPSPTGWIARPDGAVGRATLAGPTLVPVAGPQGPEYTRMAHLWSIGQLRLTGEPTPFLLDSRSRASSARSPPSRLPRLELRADLPSSPCTQQTFLPISAPTSPPVRPPSRGARSSCPTPSPPSTLALLLARSPTASTSSTTRLTVRRPTPMSSSTRRSTRS